MPTTMLNPRIVAPHPHQLLEAQLMQEMDEQILRAEESDLMRRYDASIHRAEQLEQQEAINGSTLPTTKKAPSLLFVLSHRPPSPWLFVAEQVPKAQARRRAREEAAATQLEFPRQPAGRCCYDPSSVEGLEYVVATKLIPRHLGARWKTRKQLEDYFLRKFQKDHRQQEQLQQREDPLFWKGFRLRLRSANPSAWRLHVHGYRTTVDAFLQCLAGIFGKALRRQQQQQQHENTSLVVVQREEAANEPEQELEDHAEI